MLPNDDPESLDGLPGSIDAPQRLPGKALT